jgi:ABC-type sugar transport system substrate-binding protein
VLYIQGPSENSAARERTEGMRQTKLDAIQVQILKAKWTEESSRRAVESWLSLTTSRNVRIDLVAAQDDSMAMGARGAFEQIDPVEREKWLRLPYIGCDGLPQNGAGIRTQRFACGDRLRPAKHAIGTGDARESFSWRRTGSGAHAYSTEIHSFA